MALTWANGKHRVASHANRQIRDFGSRRHLALSQGGIQFCVKANDLMAPSCFRLLIVTDAWKPQINGVSRTYQWLEQHLRQRVTLEMFTPAGFATFPMPGYPDIRLALARPGSIHARMDKFQPDVVHIATEGPLGHIARRYCLRQNIPFTTCYHTRYPEYISVRYPVPEAWTYAMLRGFHNAAQLTMTATPELAEELRGKGFSKSVHWRRGVDTRIFVQGPVAEFDWPRPWFLYAGRVAVEKNLPAFLGLDLPGTKIVAGDGPSRAQLEAQFPAAKFLGALESRELAKVYRAADVFVFPSLTDTYGLVMAEALAAGTPVAAFPSSGARAILDGEDCGVLSDDLAQAAMQALTVPRDVCARAGARHSLEASADAFLTLVDQARRQTLAADYAA